MLQILAKDIHLMELQQDRFHTLTTQICYLFAQLSYVEDHTLLTPQS